MKNNCYRVVLGFINNLFSVGHHCHSKIVNIMFPPGSCLLLLFRCIPPGSCLILFYSAASVFTDWFLICISHRFLNFTFFCQTRGN